MNRGAFVLKQLLPARKQVEYARRWGIDTGRLSKILSAKDGAKPTPQQRARIEDDFPQVYWRLWDDELDSGSGEHGAVNPDAEAS